MPSAPPTLADVCGRGAAGRATAALERAGFQPGVRLGAKGSGSANLSRCRMDAPGAEVEVSHDEAPQARRRYFIRVTELAQFSATNRRLAPRPVEGVGARRLEGAGANWVPAQRRLISIKGGTFQAVQVYARGIGDRDLRTAAIEIAREFEKLP